jgi:hypothetical protein
MKTRTLLLALLSIACGKSDVTPIVVPTGPIASQTPETVKPAPKRTSITINKRLPRVGDKRVEVSATEIDFTMSMAQIDVKMSIVDRLRQEEELLDVADGAIRKLRVTFRQDEKTTTDGNTGTPRKEPSAIHGKTYVVTARKGDVDVRDDQGKLAPPAEGALVTKKYKTLGKLDPLLVAIPERPIAFGEEVPALANALVSDMLQRKNTEGEKIDVDSPRVVLRDADASSAFFDVDMMMRADGGGTVSMSMHLVGTVAVTIAEGRVSSATLGAPIEMVFGGGSMANASGNGSLKYHATFSYEP